MNRIASTFQALGDSPALIPFITAGYPTIATCGRILNALPKHGADLVELGMPFSDPVADGKPLQKAADVALENGTGMRQVFELTKQFRTANPNTPLILMGYINPIYQMGYATFARKASQAGADAILVVDLPLEESALLLAALTKQRGIMLRWRQLPEPSLARWHRWKRNSDIFIAKPPCQLRLVSALKEARK